MYSHCHFTDEDKESQEVVSFSPNHTVGQCQSWDFFFYPHLSDSRVQISPPQKTIPLGSNTHEAGLRWWPQMKIVYLRSNLFFVNLLFEIYVYISLTSVHTFINDSDLMPVQCPAHSRR